MALITGKRPIKTQASVATFRNSFYLMNVSVVWDFEKFCGVKGFVEARPNRPTYRGRFVLRGLANTIFDDFCKGRVRTEPIRLSSIEVNRYAINLNVGWAKAKDLPEAEVKDKIQNTLDCLVHIVTLMWGGQRLSREARHFRQLCKN
ncbi:hypothetical protein CCACVL1_18617 [Corchorus capsularis]|uniref:Uncharacterized protein n=1 Tax=Corchorus capsularis TaxID=210143 RepID=A0A1R3HKR6_COCAP|nr:hypothetical protein CCACVL1_18617 [Corchorus capsularis]